MTTRSRAAARKAVNLEKPARPLPGAKTAGQWVLVLQGGGALGAYQLGVYEALHEAGIEPDWVIGTSIGAINGAIIAGNPPQRRMERLEAFWARMERRAMPGFGLFGEPLQRWLALTRTIGGGIPAFFAPSNISWTDPRIQVGAEHAAYYDTRALRDTLDDLVDFDYLAASPQRLTVGAVSAHTGEMKYFDSRAQRLGALHVMASGALPPAFPAVRIDGEPYWDGGLYSNTPIEAVLDDSPRRDSVIFSVQLWNPHGDEPRSLWEVHNRIKDIQYSSRARSHIERHRQAHRLRHVVRELSRMLPDNLRESAQANELAAWGCSTTMHVVKLNAPALPGEDQYKDIDFTTHGIKARRQAGYEETRSVLQSRPWEAPVDPIEGVMVHEVDSGQVHHDHA